MKRERVVSLNWTHQRRVKRLWDAAENKLVTWGGKGGKVGSAH